MLIMNKELCQDSGLHGFSVFALFFQGEVVSSGRWGVEVLSAWTVMKRSPRRRSNGIDTPCTRSWGAIRRSSLPKVLGPLGQRASRDLAPISVSARLRFAYGRKRSIEPPASGFSELLFEAFPIDVIAHDVLPAVAAGHQVADRARVPAP